MAIIRQDLAKYGKKIVEARLTAGAGGNISARDGRLIWIKPSGLGMEELTGRTMSGIELSSGRQIEGSYKPSSELPMHRAIYKIRPDINAIFHVHSPWVNGVISCGADLKPMFAEVINDLGRIAQVPYKLTSSSDLAEATAEAAKDADTLFLTNHGMVALGKTLKQAFYRCCVAEDAARSYVAANIAGTPVFLTEDQIQELKGLQAGAHRIRMMERE